MIGVHYRTKLNENAWGRARAPQFTWQWSSESPVDYTGQQDNGGKKQKSSLTTIIMEYIMNKYGI